MLLKEVNFISIGSESDRWLRLVIERCRLYCPHESMTSSTEFLQPTFKIIDVLDLACRTHVLVVSVTSSTHDNCPRGCDGWPPTARAAKWSPFGRGNQIKSKRRIARSRPTRVSTGVGNAHQRVFCAVRLGVQRSDEHVCASASPPPPPRPPPPVHSLTRPLVHSSASLLRPSVRSPTNLEIRSESCRIVKTNQ